MLFRTLLTGLPVILACLVLQAIFVALCLRYYVRYQLAHQSFESPRQDIMLLATVMMLTLIGNFAQIMHLGRAVPATRRVRRFSYRAVPLRCQLRDLGYGDIVMSERWRLLGPLEGANGILMFGVSTAVMTAAVMDVIKDYASKLRQGGPPR